MFPNSFKAFSQDLYQFLAKLILFALCVTVHPILNFPD